MCYVCTLPSLRVRGGPRIWAHGRRQRLLFSSVSQLRFRPGDCSACRFCTFTQVLVWRDRRSEQHRRSCLVFYVIRMCLLVNCVPLLVRRSFRFLWQCVPRHFSLRESPADTPLPWRCTQTCDLYLACCHRARRPSEEGVRRGWMGR